MEFRRASARDDWPPPYERHPTGLRAAGIAVVLLLHVAITLLWNSLRDSIRPIRVNVVEVRLLPEPRLPAPPPPKSEEVRRERKELPAPIHLPPPVVKPEPEAPPEAIHSPPERSMQVDESVWERPAEGPTGPVVRRAPQAYAEAVKARVLARVIYPTDAVYEKPRDFHGDPNLLMRQCTVPYELVVNRQGRIVAYKIEPCDDNQLDAAAEAAILSAQPYPPPPDGAEQYRIYASINFIARTASAAAQGK